MKGLDLAIQGRWEGVRRIFFVLALLLAGQCRGLADFSTNGVVVTLADPLMKLTPKGWTNGQARFSLSGEAGMNYVIESSPDLVNWTPVATNQATPNLALAVSNDAAYFRVSRSPLPLCLYAIGAQGDIDFNGNGVETDSFNSGDTNLSTNGKYNPVKTSTNGSVASVAGIVNFGNHTIEGNVYLGPSASYTGGGIVTGTVYADQNVQIPDVALPNVNWLTAIPLHGFHDFVANGYYAVNDSLSITVEPGVIAVLKLSTTSFSPASVNILGGMTNSGTLVMYQISGSAALVGSVQGGAINGQPRNFVYLGLPGVTSISMGGANATFVGVIYAPEAALVLNGGGNSGSMMGACVVGSVSQSGSYNVHFDENLLTSGVFR